MPGLVSTHVELKRNLSFSPGFRVSKQIRSKNWIGIESKWVFSQLDVTALKSESWSQWVFSLFLRTFLAAQLILRWPTTVTAKAKTSRQNQNTPRQNQKPHGKTKDLTAKPNTSQQKTKYPTAKANTHGKTKVILLTVKYLVFPWDFLFSLPWGILFLPWGFCFCRDTVVGHHTASIWHKRKTF